MAQDQRQTPAITTTPPPFTVHRRELVLVGPAGPTPRETKRLSDIDDQEGLRQHMRTVFFYRRGGAGAADAIRRALAEALVPYYPLAGRLREVEERKLVVDCTGEGAAFVEADADVRLAELEAAGPLVPPFPWIDQLSCDVNRSSGVLNCPLLFIQVTRLLCGGFVLALHWNHNMVDGIGQDYFLSTVAELARGGHAAPSTTAVLPPWSRELLEARVPPRPPAFPHRVYDAAAPLPPQGDDMAARTFTFAQRDVAAIKGSLTTRLRGTVTTFEVLASVLWRARTAALQIPPHEEVRLLIIVNLRDMRELGLPARYYGNAIVPSAVVTTAAELQASSLGDTVEMVREAKAAVTAEYVRSTIDVLVLRGRPPMLAAANLLAVSDHRHLGLHHLDLGWGVPVYGGIATVMKFNYLVPVRDGDGEDAVAVPVMLPRPAMDRFASELEKMVSPSLVHARPGTHRQRGYTQHPGLGTRK